MPFDKYLKLFIGTCICRDTNERRKYKFSNVVTNLTKHEDYFYKFTLKDDLEMEEQVDMFAMIIEQ